MNRYLATTFIICVFVGPSIVHAQTEANSLQLRVEPTYFSPNADGLQDQTFFYPVLKSHTDIQEWNLDLFVAKGHRRVLRLSGTKFPALLKWDGFDKKGVVVPDASMIAEFRVDGQKTDLSEEQSFFIDTIAPQVTVSLSTSVVDLNMLQTGNVVFSPRVFDASPVDHWLLQVLDVTGRTVTLFWSSDTVHDVTWDGLDRTTGVFVPQGKYRVVVQAWDKAGNESAPFFNELTFNISAREMLNQALSQIQVNETAMGLIVQLDANRLFIKRGTSLEMTEEGAGLLKEVAILANAYPSASIKLDGYSRAQKTAGLDREKGSIYAWRVYSYLSKTGNVKASRVTVRGRGRSPMFDRRGVTVPMLSNGVEVVLEGPGPW